jgi:hypothetical protein
MQTLSGFFGLLSNDNSLSPVNLSNNTDSSNKDIESKIDRRDVRLYEPNVQLSAQSYNERMIDCLNKIKNDLFDPLTFQHWNNVAICGGYVLDLLYNTTSSSDIDIYIYNTKSQTLVNTIADKITSLIKGDILYETKGVLTLRGSNGKHVQIINTSNRNTLSDILTNFDLSICRVCFDGYQILAMPDSLSELMNRTIMYDKNQFKHQSAERLAKYVHKKQLGLVVNQTVIDSIDPLYLFRESHGINKFMQMTKLLQNATLQNVYKMLSIKTNFDSNNLNAIVKYSGRDKLAQYDVNESEETALTGKALTSCIKDKVCLDMSMVNIFGQPKLFESIKKGNYVVSDLYGQQINDISGFNVTCMMVLYEPDEQKVIDFLKDIYKVGSKNVNRYKMNYLTMASLLNRLKIVSFLMNATNYRKVMNVAMKEDNLELYKLAYCSHSSKDRYLYDKETLLKYNAHTIYAELYDDDNVNETKQNNRLTDDLTSALLDMNVAEFIIKYSKMSSSDRKNITNYLVKKSVKVIKIPSLFVLSDIPEAEQIVYNIFCESINKSTNKHYNLLLKNIMTYDLYTKSIEKTFENPFNNKSIEDRALYLNIYATKKVPLEYKFDDQLINELIIHMDDSTMISQSPYKRFLMDMLQTRSDSEPIGSNIRKYVDEHLRKTTDPTLYSEILSNTMDHDLAYTTSTLNPGYCREENALGYTPCDIIIYQTFKDYANNYGVVETKKGKILFCDPQYSIKYLNNRRKSVRVIDRSVKIMPYIDQPDKDAIMKLLPELIYS